jgi:hypothetical protein
MILARLEVRSHTACYIPPEGSVIHGRPAAEDPWQALQRRISQQAELGEPVLLMGDFNARTGGLPESPDLEELKYALPDMPELGELLQQDLPPRRSTDPNSNAFGKELLGLLASRAMCIFNGRVPGTANHEWTSLNYLSCRSTALRHQVPQELQLTLLS